MMLFRPVGLAELELIVSKGNQEFPPRLDWQPIFYPVLNDDYAVQIARKWNTLDEFSGFVGFVTEFEVDDEYISHFETQNVGGSDHNEFWIPSEELTLFNHHIIDRIQVTASFYGDSYLGKVKETNLFKELTVDEQALKLTKDLASFLQNIEAEHSVVLANYTYWEFHKLVPIEVLDEIQVSWNKVFPEIHLSRERRIRRLTN